VDRDSQPVAADFYVDVSSVFEKKTEMLARHRSQREWLLKHHGIDDYLAMMERWTREIGKRARLELAEGFRRYKGHPYPQSALLEELLAGSAELAVASV
jgi:LmbE family N-acetylglucosaminyl deacetylase